MFALSLFLRVFCLQNFGFDIKSVFYLSRACGLSGRAVKAVRRTELCGGLSYSG